MPRWVKLFGRRAASAADIEKQLGQPEPDLQVRLTGMDQPRALKSREDLTQLAVFQGLLPAAVLPRPALAEALLTLQQGGWAFASETGQIGPLGAYQDLAAGGVQGQWHGQKLALELAGVGALAAFYHPEQPDPLAQLARDGYDFYDAQGQAALPHLGQSVGKGAAWLPVTQASELPAFERFHPEQGDLKLTQQLFSAPLEQTGAVLKGAGQADYARLVPAAVERLKGFSGPDLVGQAAGLPAHPAWLQAVQDDPQVGAAARVTARLLEVPGAWAHFQSHATEDALTFSTSLLQTNPKSEVAREVLTALKADPETRMGASALEKWQPESLVTATTRLLANPRLSETELDRWGRELCQGDKEREARLLESRAERGNAAARMASAVYRQLESHEARNLVFEAGLGSAEGVALYQPLFAALEQGSSWQRERQEKDAFAIAPLARQDLQALPVMQALNRWGKHNDMAAVKIALQKSRLQTPEELHQLGVSLANIYNQNFCRTLLKEQLTLWPSQSEATRVALDLLPALTSRKGQESLWRTATDRDCEPQKLYETILRACQDETSSYDRDKCAKDATLIAGKLRTLLADSPVLAALDRWSPTGDEATKIRQALDNRHRTTPESIHELGVKRCSVYNLDDCQRMLQEQQALGGTAAQAAPIAARLLPELQSNTARQKLWELATTDPAVVCDEKRLHAALLEVGGQSSYQREKERADHELAARHLRPLLASHPLLQALDRWPVASDDVSKVGRVLSHESARTPEQVHRVGLGMANVYNVPFCLALLKEQEAFGGERADASRLAQELLPTFKSNLAREKAFRLATDDPATGRDPRAACGLLLRQLEDGNSYQREQIEQDAQLLAARMRPLVAGNPVLQALDRWQAPTDEVSRMRLVAEKSEVKTTADIHRIGVGLSSQYNPGLCQRLLGEQLALGGEQERAAKLALDLFDRLSSHEGRRRVWEMATRTPGQADHPHEVYRDLLVALRAESHTQREAREKDVAVVAAQARNLLAGDRVLAALDRWQHGDEAGRVLLALQNPNADPLVLGASIVSDWDTGFQRHLLAETPGPHAKRGLDLSQRCQSRAGQAAVFRQGMTASTTAEFYRGALETLAQGGQSWQAAERLGDAELVARTALHELAGETDTRAGARQALAWKHADPVRAARAILARPELQGNELALAIAQVHEQELQNETLAGQDSDLARLTLTLREKVTTPQARYALWRGAMERPGVTDADAVRAFGKNVLAHYDRETGGRGRERAELEGLVETYVSVVSLVGKPTLSGVEEQDGRVLVGGVVVKKNQGARG